MDNNTSKFLDETKKEMVEVIDKHLGETYDNITQDPSKALGSGLADLIYLVFSPIKYYSSKVKLYFDDKIMIFQKELEEQRNALPSQNIVEPDIHTVLEIIDNARFCITDDELRKMFVNLIVGTINSETSDYAHPAFATIIRQMTATDAKILKLFKDHKDLTAVTVNHLYNPNEEMAVIRLSIDNLIHLGLIKNDYALDNPFKVHRGELEINPKSISEDKIKVTTMGKKFIDICCV